MTDGTRDVDAAELGRALTALVERLCTLARADAELREALAGIGRQLASLDGSGAAADAASVPGAVAGPGPEAEEAPGAEAERVVPERLSLAAVLARALEAREEAQARPRRAVPMDAESVAGTGAAREPEPTSGHELALVQQRCRLKAEGARWAAERRRRLGEGADFQTEIAPRDRDLVDRARSLPSCFLWMNDPGLPVQEHPSLLEDLAGCFDALAAGVALARQVVDAPGVDDESLEAAMELVSEGQSALRAAVRDIDDERRDSDQFAAYKWLKEICRDRQIYMRRYMRLDDTADPTAWHDLQSRVAALESRFGQARQHEARRRGLLNQLRYHAKLLRTEPVGRPHDWQRLIEAADVLVESGLPASNVELREIILPVLDQLPESLTELPRNFERVLSETDRYLAARPAASPPAQGGPASAVEVAEVAALLTGRRAVLIGGLCRPDAKRALETAFGLSELIWTATREHESVASFEAAIARPDVALVLLAIRWSSHSFGEVRSFCMAHDKPLVRLPGGYGVNQVAVQILRQASGQLRFDRDSSLGA